MTLSVWSNEEMTDLITALSELDSNNRIFSSVPSSLFYTIPTAVFTDASSERDEEIDQTVMEPIEAQSPMADLFANWQQPENPNSRWQQEEHEPVEHESCTAQSLVTAVENEYLLGSLTEYSLDELVCAADKALEAMLTDEAIGRIVNDFGEKLASECNPTRQLVTLALIVARFSISRPVPRELFHSIVEICGSAKSKESDSDNDKKLSIWTDVFSTLVSSGRLNSSSTIRFFSELLGEHWRNNRCDVGELIGSVANGVKGWTEYVVEFLIHLLKMTTPSEPASRQVLFFINEFDLKNLTTALLQVVTLPELRSVATSQSYFSLLSSLARNFPSFVQKSSEFAKTVSELIQLSKTGQHGSVSSLSYRRLLNMTGANSSN